MGLRDDLAAMDFYQKRGRLGDYMRGETGPTTNPETGNLEYDHEAFDPVDARVDLDDSKPHAKASTNWGAIKARGIGD